MGPRSFHQNILVIHIHKLPNSSYFSFLGDLSPNCDFFQFVQPHSVTCLPSEENLKIFSRCNNASKLGPMCAFSRNCMVYLAIVCFFRQKWPENSAKMEDEKIRSNRIFCKVLDYEHGKLGYISTRDRYLIIFLKFLACPP